MESAELHSKTIAPMLLQLDALCGTAWLDLQELRSRWETVKSETKSIQAPVTKSGMKAKYPKQPSNCPKHKNMFSSELPAEIMVCTPHFG